MAMGGDALKRDRRKIADFVNAYVETNGYDVVMKNQELIALFDANGVAPESQFYLNSDLCYNRINDGIIDDFKDEIHVFESVKRGYYRLLGENYEYTGNILHKKKAQPEYIAGQWEDGKIISWNPIKG